MDEISVIRYSADDKERWNKFVRSAKNGLFLFDRNYMDYHSDRFLDHSLLFYKEDRLVAVLPASEKDGALVSHGGLTYGGFLLDSTAKQHTVNACAEAMVRYAGENGLQEIQIKTIPHMFHLQPAEEEIYALHRLGARPTEVTAATVLNLKDRLKMPKGRKAQISRAFRSGIEICLLKEKADFDRFIDLENEVLEKWHGAKAVHSADELFLLYTRFPKNIHLYGAFKEDKMISGAVLFEYERAVHTQYLASNDVGRELGGLDLVIATIIQDYQDTKDWLDFGTSNEDHGRYLNEGLIAQKEGFGGRTNVCMLWTLQV